MSAELLLAYAQTRYLVLDRGGSVAAEARVGEPSPSLDALLAENGATSGVFITAWNPRSEPAAPEVNDVAHCRLAEEVVAAGWVGLPHRGVGADPSWTEQGLLVLDLGEDEGLALATRYRQNAIVVVDVGRPARLVLTLTG